MLRYDWNQQDSYTILHWCGTLIPKQLTMAVALRLAEETWEQSGFRSPENKKSSPLLIIQLWKYVRCKGEPNREEITKLINQFLDERIPYAIRSSMMALDQVLADPANIAAHAADPRMVRQLIPFEAVKGGKPAQSSDDPNPGLDHWAWKPFMGHKMVGRKLVDQRYAFTGITPVDLMMETDGVRLLASKTIRKVSEEGTFHEKVTLDQFLEENDRGGVD